MFFSPSARSNFHVSLPGQREREREKAKITSAHPKLPYGVTIKKTMRVLTTLPKSARRNRIIYDALVLFYN
jgi:hypothetical protein